MPRPDRAGSGRYVFAATGTTDDVTTCEICGKDDLKNTIVLTVTGPDGDIDGIVYAGSDCGAELAGRPAGDLRREARNADKAARAAEREAEAKRQAARSEAGNAAFLAWVASRYGITVDQPGDLWDYEKTTGMTPFRLRRAWKAST